MGTTNSTENITKKEIKKLVYSKLEDALLEFKSILKRKKFDNKVQKAAKLFTSDLIKANRKGKLKIEDSTVGEDEQANDDDADD